MIVIIQHSSTPYTYAGLLTHGRGEMLVMEKDMVSMTVKQCPWRLTRSEWEALSLPCSSSLAFSQTRRGASPSDIGGYGGLEARPSPEIRSHFWKEYFLKIKM
jgi:hypothetical protein